MNWPCAENERLMHADGGQFLYLINKQRERDACFEWTALLTIKTAHNQYSVELEAEVTKDGGTMIPMWSTP
jgi:hypothetical protein